MAVQWPPGPIKSAGVRRPVTITPISVNTLPCSVSTVPKTSTVIDKVLLKAVSRAGKNIFKMFTLRNIDCSKVRSRDDLSDEIRRQLLGDIIQDEFDVGFVSGNSIISISRGVGRNLEKGGQVNEVTRAKHAKNFRPETTPTIRKPHYAVLVPGGPYHAISTSASRISDQNGFITSLCMIFSKCKDY